MIIIFCAGNNIHDAIKSANALILTDAYGSI